MLRRGYSIFSLEELSQAIGDASMSRSLRQIKGDASKPAEPRDIKRLPQVDIQPRVETKPRRVFKSEAAVPLEKKPPAINMMSARPPVSFLEAGVPEWLYEQMQAHHLVHPTPLQRTLLQAMIGQFPRDAMVHAETGCGKSLGYLIAALGGLNPRQEERLALPNPHFSPQTIIVVPGAILATQLIRWTRSLLPAYPLNQVVRVAVSEGDAERFERELLQPGPSHLLICTPSGLHRLMQAGQLSPVRLRRLVIDEVDAMLPKEDKRVPAKPSWHQHPSPLLDSLQALRRQWSRLALPGRFQTVLVSATLCPRTRHRVRQLGIVEGEVLVEAKPAAGERKPLNDLRLPAGIQHWYRRVSSPGLDSIAQEIARLIGRWHEREEAGRERGLIVLGDGESKRDLQLALQAWECPTRLLSNSLQTGLTGGILLGSHSDARGLDIPDLAWVLLVGLPPTLQDYVHLAGRVGRLGRTGHAYTLLLDERQVERSASLYARLGLQAAPVPML